MSEPKITRYRVRIKTDRYTLRHPFTAVFLSDLHNASYGEKNQRFLQMIRQEKPELILSAGDLVTAGTFPETENALELLEKLTRNYPVYCSNGNHEQRLKNNAEKYGDAYAKFTERIKSAGVQVLENESDSMRINGLPLRFWGLELSPDYFSRFKRRKLSSGELREILGMPDPDSYNILLAHNPVYGETYAKWGADLTLAGHLHGGIIRLPGIGGMFSPQFRLFPKYNRGLYTIGRKKMIVSGGLGSHTIPIRINNPLQLVVIEFS